MLKCFGFYAMYLMLTAINWCRCSKDLAPRYPGFLVQGLEPSSSSFGSRTATRFSLASRSGCGHMLGLRAWRQWRFATQRLWAACCRDRICSLNRDFLSAVVHSYGWTASRTRRSKFESYSVQAHRHDCVEVSHYRPL